MLMERSAPFFGGCRGDQLELEILPEHKLSEHFRALIILFLEAGFESTIGEMFVYFLICTHIIDLTPILNHL